MAGAYQSQGGDIGTLLRLIQEEKSSSLLNQPPSADPNSPIRQQTQGPLLAPEAPGGTRNVSLRPEGIGALGPAEQVGSVVPPMAPRLPMVGPVMAPTMVSRPGSNGGGGGSPSRPNPTPVPTPTQRPSLPSIGTRISNPGVLGASTKAQPKALPTQQKTPTRGNQPGAIGTPKGSKIPFPTPTMVPSNMIQKVNKNQPGRIPHYSYLS